MCTWLRMAQANYLSNCIRKTTIDLKSIIFCGKTPRPLPLVEYIVHYVKSQTLGLPPDLPPKNFQKEMLYNIHCDMYYVACMIQSGYTFSSDSPVHVYIQYYDNTMFLAVLTSRVTSCV